jgi:hypothetical protein
MVSVTIYVPQSLSPDVLLRVGVLHRRHPSQQSVFEVGFVFWTCSSGILNWLRAPQLQGLAGGPINCSGTLTILTKLTNLLRLPGKEPSDIIASINSSFRVIANFTTHITLLACQKKELHLVTYNQRRPGLRWAATYNGLKHLHMIFRA